LIYTLLTKTYPSSQHLLTESAALGPVLTLFTHGETSDLSDPAILKFLNDYDLELARLKEITRLGGTHGSRRWDEKSLTALISRSALICGAKNENNCVHSCEVLLKTVGAPTLSALTDSTNSTDSTDTTPDQPHLAGLINHSTCKIPSYATLFKYLKSRTRQLSVPSTGYVSHSESLSSHHDVALNVAIGRDAVRAMGVEPSPLAWQIDSFGHSATTAKVLREAGVEAAVYNRADKSIKHKVQREGGRFTWSLPEGAPTEGKVTHHSSSSSETVMQGILLLDHYNSPATSPFTSSKLVTQEMIEQAASSIYKSSYLPLHLSKSRHLLYPIGDDNAFLATAQYFEALGERLCVCW
jgi:hypothetical protein